LANFERVFITGVGGFIGLRLARHCLRRGMGVSGVDHEALAVARARELGVDATLANICDVDALRVAMKGADVAVHTAAIVREHGERSEFEKVNIEGTRKVAHAALACGVRVFVQLSSVMVYGFEFPEQVGEDGPLRGEGNLYCQTKIASERLVLELDGPGFAVLVIRPGDVYGPGSMPWIARPLAMLRKRQLILPSHGRGMINHVFVDDLVDGILLAIDSGVHGQALNISGGIASTCADYFGALAAHASLPGPIALPTSVMRGLVSIMSMLYRMGLSDDEVGPDTVRMLARPGSYSIDKARRLLGYAPKVSLEEGLHRSRPFIEQELTRLATKRRMS
jgi:nucleoside-diphosphate-sugar epimerase